MMIIMIMIKIVIVINKSIYMFTFLTEWSNLPLKIELFLRN